MVRITVAASARTAGMAFIAAVVDGSPALRPVSNWTVRPSGLMYKAVARSSEREPGGGLVSPPNPAAVYAVVATARPPNTTRPATRVGTGWRTIRTETRPQTPVLPVPA